MTKEIKQEQDEPWLLNTAQNLAKFMAKNFYPEVTHWKVSDNLVSVILQIDNMVTGLIRKSKQEQGEPVAYINVEQRKLEWAKYTSWDTPTVVNLPKIPLYTTPQGCAECGVGGGYALYCVACAEKFFEAKLKEKNN